MLGPFWSDVGALGDGDGRPWRELGRLGIVWSRHQWLLRRLSFCLNDCWDYWCRFRDDR